MMKWFIDNLSKKSGCLSKWYRQMRREESLKCVQTILKNYHEGYINMSRDGAETLYLWSLRIKRDKE